MVRGAGPQVQPAFVYRRACGVESQPRQCVLPGMPGLDEKRRILPAPQLFLAGMASERPLCVVQRQQLPVLRHRAGQRNDAPRNSDQPSQPARCASWTE